MWDPDPALHANVRKMPGFLQPKAERGEPGLRPGVSALGKPLLFNVKMYNFKINGETSKPRKPAVSH